MARKLVLMLVVFVLVSFGSITKSQNKLFVYYPTWAPYTMPPSDLKFPSGIRTYYMHFSAHASTTSPYFSVVVSGNTDSADLAYKQQALIDTCHHAGQKVLLSITAQDNTLGNLTAAQQKVFASSVCSYLKRKGYDGVDLDWEINLSSAAVASMVKTFRDTLNTWSPPGMLVMSVLTDPFTYPTWNFYNISAMNQYLDAYFTMSYGMHGVERQADALGTNSWRCMFDCPYTHPTGTPWSGFAGGYWAADFKGNSITKWMARGADTTKIGVGLWNGGTRMTNSNSSMIPGSVISYGTANFPTYPQVLAGTSNYDAATDSWWGIVGGYYTSWIDSAGAYKRTKWAKDTMHTNTFMLYDAYSGFIDLPARYGRQPHFDAMVNAINATQGTLPTGTLSVTPDTLPVGGGSVTLTWISNGATGASIDQGIGSVSLGGDTIVTVGQTKTFTLTLSNSSGSRSYATRVGVALPGGQGTQDITSQATIIALVPNPTGGGNPNIEIIRDGINPPLGSGNVLDQFDTYTGGQPRDLDWIGYTFTTAKQFTSLIYQEGLDNQWGGCFQPLRVQVRNNGLWTDVQGLVITPPYPGSNLVSFETYQLNFNSTTGDAIRIAGPPTGQGHYIGVGELRVLSTSGTGIGPTPGLPKNFELMQNYPNPFNPTTRISFALPADSPVRLTIFDMLGQEVATLVDEFMRAGVQTVGFSGENLANGVYIYSIKAGSFSDTQKMVLMK
jgi:hypothetical protein